MTTTDERRQTCDHCRTTQPLTDLNLWWGAGVQIECKDTDACKARGQARQVRYTDPDHDDECEAEFVAGAFTWTTCRCADRLADEDAA